MITPRVLIIDNNRDQNIEGLWPMGAPFRRYLNDCIVEVRRGPECDFDLKTLAFSHLILSGSKTSCLSKEEWIEKQLELIHFAAKYERPILGICFGHQMIARAFGGIECLQRSSKPEYGWVELLKAGDEHELLKTLPQQFVSFQAHVEEVKGCPSEFRSYLSSENCSIQAIAHEKKKIFGLQFHPERNFEEGAESIQNRRKDKSVSKDCIFDVPRAKSRYSESIAQEIFSRFTKL